MGKCYKDLFKSANSSYEAYKKDLDSMTDKSCEKALLAKGAMSALESQFPELNESEDDKNNRIKERLIDIINGCLGVRPIDEEREELLAWLDKQGEQMPAWSEEDNNRIDNLCYFLEEYGNQYYGHLTLQNTISWLKLLKYRVQTQSKQEWSEEDEIGLADTLWCCNQAASIAKDENNAWHAKKWLKSIKDRYTWKPSDEQMEALDDFIYSKYPNVKKHEAAVKSLYQDLKKLREE